MKRTPSPDPYPRSLSAREAEILRFLLEVDDDRLAPLRLQAPTAYVTAMCGCGCATRIRAVRVKSYSGYISPPATAMFQASLNTE